MSNPNYEEVPDDEKGWTSLEATARIKALRSQLADAQEELKRLRALSVEQDNLIRAVAVFPRERWEARWPAMLGLVDAYVDRNARAAVLGEEQPFSGTQEELDAAVNTVDDQKARHEAAKYITLPRERPRVIPGVVFPPAYQTETTLVLPAAIADEETIKRLSGKFAHLAKSDEELWEIMQD